MGKNAADTKEGVQDPQGEPEEQASADQKGQTSPQNDLPIEPGKTYMVRGEAVLGENLLNAIARGQLASKFQSDLHKTQAELEQTTEQLQELQAERSKQTQRSDFLALLEEAGIKPVEKTTQPADAEPDYEDIWGTELTAKPQQPTVDPAQLVEVMRKAVQPVIAEQGKALKNEITQHQQKIDAERAQKEQAKEWVETTREARAKLVKDRYELDDAAVKRVLDMQDLIRVKENEANEKGFSGDPDEAVQAREAWELAQALDSQVHDILADATVKKRQRDLQLELEAEVEGGSYVGLPERAADPERKITYDAKERTTRRKAAVNAAADLIGKLKRAKSASGQ